MTLAPSPPAAPEPAPVASAHSGAAGHPPAAPEPPRGLLARLKSAFPAGQVVRYLCVGVFNTVFGYTTFALINYALRRRNVPLSYIWASILSNIVNNTVAYLGYKLFVFKTRGNYVHEWLKAMAVYFSGMIPGLLLLSVLVRVLNWLLPHQLTALGHTVTARELAPYIANAVCIAIGVVISFLGHKNITFRPRDKTAASA